MFSVERSWQLGATRGSSKRFKAPSPAGTERFLVSRLIAPRRVIRPDTAQVTNFARYREIICSQSDEVNSNDRLRDSNECFE